MERERNRSIIVRTHLQDDKHSLTHTQTNGRAGWERKKFSSFFFTSLHFIRCQQLRREEKKKTRGGCWDCWKVSFRAQQKFHSRRKKKAQSSILPELTFVVFNVGGLAVLELSFARNLCALWWTVVIHDRKYVRNVCSWIAKAIVCYVWVLENLEKVKTDEQEKLLFLLLLLFCLFVQRWEISKKFQRRFIFFCFQTDSLM